MRYLLLANNKATRYLHYKNVLVCVALSRNGNRVQFWE